MVKKLLTVREIAVILGVSRPTVYRKLAVGELPRPIYLGNRVPRWRPEVIEAYLSEKQAV